MKYIAKNARKYAAVLALSTAAVPAFATTADLASLTSGVDLSPIGTALGVIFLAMIGIGIFMHGGSLIARKLGWK